MHPSYKTFPEEKSNILILFYSHIPHCLLCARAQLKTAELFLEAVFMQQLASLKCSAAQSDQNKIYTCHCSTVRGTLSSSDTRWRKANQFATTFDLCAGVLLGAASCKM